MKRKKTSRIYEKAIKPIMDRLLAFIFVVVFGWLYIVVAILVRIKLGTPVIFKQDRPGKINSKTGKEDIFKLYKFRSMSNKKDSNGNLLPDEERITGFGRKLRNTSLDELPEILFNILIFHNMSWVGPRPLLVKYLPYYTAEEHQRHSVLPGLTGYAQVHGRNATTWERKFDNDIWYVNNISFINDIKIVLDTVKTVIKHEGVELNALEDFDEYRKNRNIDSEIRNTSE